MNRQLNIKYTRLPDNNIVVAITRQTHVEEEFANADEEYGDEGYGVFFARLIPNDGQYKDVLLRSAGSPAMGASGYSHLRVYVRGSDRALDNEPIRMTYAQFDGFCQAVLKYNQTYSNNTGIEMEDVMTEVSMEEVEQYE